MFLDIKVAKLIFHLKLVAFDLQFPTNSVHNMVIFNKLSAVRTHIVIKKNSKKNSCYLEGSKALIKVYKSVVSATFPMLCNHRLYLVPKHYLFTTYLRL